MSDETTNSNQAAALVVQGVVIPRNCHNCQLLGTDDSGDDWGFGSFPVCTLTYLKSEPDNTDRDGFPFDDQQQCHVPHFWAYLELDRELMEIFDSESETGDKDIDGSYTKFKEKYLG